MTKHVQPSDLEFAALISSKICHDVIGPVGAIYNGLEMIDEDGVSSSRSDTLEVVRNVAEQATARLQFARFAFGAAGSASVEIGLDQARQISSGLAGDGKKYQIIWNETSGALPKNQIKLLLNMIACALTSIPRGGTITVDVSRLGRSLKFILRCTGRAVRAPLYICELIACPDSLEIDALSVQAYYTMRLAGETGMRLSVEQHPEAVQLIAVADP